MAIVSATFVTSASKLSECPLSSLPEFALIGRSNVGKSSLINMLTQQNKLAKASVTPGKTQLLNYFLINKSRHLVDLPGYGYAKYSKKQRIEWMDTMQEYFMRRKSIRKVFVLIDGSLPPQKIDSEFLEVLHEDGINFAIIVTKVDKINQSDAHKYMEARKIEYKKVIKKIPEILISSSVKGRGRKEILEYIEDLVAKEKESTIVE